MRLSFRLGVASVAILAGAACAGDPLDVSNLTDPDVTRVFSTPASIEQTIATGYQDVHNGITINGDLMPQLLTLAVESYSQLNNFNMGVRAGIPRAPIQNVRGSFNIFNDFSRLTRGSRLSANALDALDRLVKGSGTLGSPGQDARARAFAFFSIGTHQGWLAMVYDSAAIITNGMRADSIPDLSGAQDVMKEAIRMLDSALVAAQVPAATAAGGFPLPESWLGGTATSRDDFVRLVRSYRARFRAGVARTPQQRAAVDWQAVIADTENGITKDFTVNVGGSTGWNIGFVSSQAHVDATWHQMSMMYFGMADVSGGYDAWLAQPFTQKAPFLVVTPDKRWPQGTTRGAQQTASTKPTGLSSRPYISNRTGQDSPGEPWGTSFYDFFRLRYIRDANGAGAFPEFVKAENDMLAAEGYIRTGNIAKAAEKIDLTRTARGELPALAGVVTTATQQVPGGTNCVPRVPQGPSFTSTACGTIMEAMKYEKRMETAFTSYGAWYFSMRGWGDLPEGTPLEYPVPYQEMDARQRPFYNLGGQGGQSAAAKGTYGF